MKIQSYILLLFTIFLFQITPTQQLNAFDISVYNDKIDCFQCIKEQGYDLMIIEIYSSGKVFNKNIVYNIRKAQEAGLYVHVYIFPDTQQSPVQQIHKFLGYLRAHNAKYDFVWLDVENEKLWYDDCQKNVEFLEQLTQTAELYMEPSNIGIYVSQHYWTPIMCDNDKFKNYKLWWPRWNNQKSFDSFKSFGGWDKPVMKQFTAEKPICCINDTDYDWAPGVFWKQNNNQFQDEIQN